MTPQQLKLLHVAARQCHYDREQLQLLIRNVSDQESARELTNQQFENCMAILEGCGFRQTGQPADYWRNKLELRFRFCGERMEHLIAELAGQVKGYKLPGLCMRFSQGRTDQVAKLSPREAHNLAEMLKNVIDRQPKEVVSC